MHRGRAIGVSPLCLFRLFLRVRRDKVHLFFVGPGDRVPHPSARVGAGGG